MHPVNVALIVIAGVLLSAGAVYGGVQLMLRAAEKQEALLRWAKGIPTAEADAKKFLIKNFSPAAARYLTMFFSNPNAFRCKIEHSKVVDENITSMDITIDGKTVSFWYGAKGYYHTTWSNSKKEPVAKVNMEPEILKLFILGGTKTDPVITYSESIPYTVANIDLIKCIQYVMGRCEDNAILTPMYAELKGILKKYPAEAVRFLDDPVLKDYATKLMEGA
jgi:hypothetical protein